MTVERLLSELPRLNAVPEALDHVRRAIVTMALDGRLTHRASNPLPVSPAAGMLTLLATRPRYRWEVPHRHAVTPERSVPTGWHVTRLGDTALYVNGLAFKPSDWAKTGRPIVRIQNLSGVSDTFHYTERAAEADNVISTGDLLVSWSATLDAFVWPGQEAVLNQHIFKVVPNTGAVVLRFLYWLLKREIRRLADSQHAHGLAMMHINRGPFLNHLVLLPPIEEQCRIVAKVDDLMALCDELEVAEGQREDRRNRLRAASLATVVAPPQGTPANEPTHFFLANSRRMITKPAHVAEVRQTILDLAVKGRLVPQLAADEPATVLLERVVQLRGAAGAKRTGRAWTAAPPTRLPSTRLPGGWTWAYIGEAAERVTVGHVGPMVAHYSAQGIPFVRSQNVRAGRFRWQGLVNITETFHRSIAKSALAPGDVVVVRSGNVGTACVIPNALQEANCSDVVIVKRPLALASHYLCAYLNSAATDDIARGTVGIALTHFNTRSVATMPIPVPPLSEQRRIVAKLDELMAVCDEIEACLQQAEDRRLRALEALLADVLAAGEAGTEGGA